MKLDDAWDFFALIAGAVHKFSERHPLAPDERLLLGNLIRDVAWKSRELPSEKVASRECFELWFAADSALPRHALVEAFLVEPDENTPCRYRNASTQQAWKVWQAARVGAR